jgi:hypothetical protein
MFTSFLFKESDLEIVVFVYCNIHMYSSAFLEIHSISQAVVCYVLGMSYKTLVFWVMTPCKHL